MASKQILREVYLSKRLLLSEQEFALRNRKITDSVIEYIEKNNYHNIHIFLPIWSKKEIDTKLIIDHFQDHSAVRFIVPKTLSNSELSHYILNENCHIEINKWGIPEPVKGDLADLSKIDLILVPLIIADKKGNRIGYGKGFYDRFLNIVEARKVGLSILPLLDEILYIEETDIKLDQCFTYY